MPGNRALYEQLKKDGFYTKSFEEFTKQFSNPEKLMKLHSVMQADKLYSRTADDFVKQFYTPIKTEEKIPSYKYQSTRNYANSDKYTMSENVALEKKFGQKYGDKNLWSRYAYINSDETLKDLLIENENKIDPYLLGGLISAEGMIDELHGAKVAGDPTTLADYVPNMEYNSGNGPDPIGDSISGISWFGTDTFTQRYREFKEKGLTSLEPMPDYDYANRKWKGKYDPAKADKYFIGDVGFTNEKGEYVMSADFFTPRAGINAVSAYAKNIENILDSSNVKLTPQEKEQLIYIGYNYGEGGLSKYLSKGKTGKEILDKIKSERPQVYKKSMLRLAVANELRENRSLEPLNKEGMKLP